MAHIKIDFILLGRKWTLKLLDKHKYFRRNGGKSLATTWSDRQIHLSPRGLDIETIRHELVHAYQHEMCAGSLNEMSKADIEEWIAELVGRRGPELLAIADEIYAKLKQATMKVKVKV